MRWRSRLSYPFCLNPKIHKYLQAVTRFISSVGVQTIFANQKVQRPLTLRIQLGISRSLYFVHNNVICLHFCLHHLCLASYLLNSCASIIIIHVQKHNRMYYYNIETCVYTKTDKIIKSLTRKIANKKTVSEGKISWIKIEVQGFSHLFFCSILTLPPLIRFNYVNYAINAVNTFRWK